MSARTLLRAVWDQNRSLLMAVLSLSVFSFSFYLYQSQVVVARLVDLRIKQTTLQQQLRQADAAQAGSGILTSEAERIDDELQQFQALIPDKKQFSVFIGELFTWGEKTDLEITQVNYSPKVDQESGLLQYGLSFSVGGKYEQLKRFIHLLENSPRILIIDQISLSGYEKSEQSRPGVKLQIQLTTFFREQRL